MEQVLDPSWYRVAALRPRLRPHVQVHRHHYRGQRWYLIQDLVTGRFHRFTPVANRIIGWMDGARTLDQIWEQAAHELGDEAPTQGETLRLLHQLHAADLLQSDLPADPDELLRRHQRDRRNRWLQQVKSPLAIRVPLLDPDPWLSRVARLVRPLFGRFGVLLWLGVVIGGTVTAALHWPELRQDISGNLLAPQNLLLIGLVFPLVKTLHELGHACAVKVWGGEVHQLGVMFLVFMPIPYVDASASIAFIDKYRRALVGAAGMLVELFVAALAVFLWVAAEPGLVKATAYNVILIAGVSTLVFNGNPLLRFDAYYILSDLIEIPNLAQRANQYVFYLIQRYPFGLREARSPVNAPGEARWFLVYAPLSFIYRMVLFSSIVLFVGAQFFFIGVLLACWAAFSLFIQPAFKGMKYLATSPSLRDRRPRALAISAALAAALVLLVFALPLPLSTLTQGVAWAPEGLQIRVAGEGFVARLEARPGAQVTAGQPVALLDDPLLGPELKVLKGELAVLEARYDYYREEDRVQAEIAREQIAGVQAQLARKWERIADLEVRAPSAGRLVIPGADDLPGRFLQKGHLLGYVIAPGRISVRTVVSQDDVDLIRGGTRGVQVRRTEAIGEVIPASIVGLVPTASAGLPSAALGTQGGGSIPIDPRDPKGGTALTKVFQFDLTLPPEAALSTIGSRVYVRFEHPPEPLAARWYRALRRVFLSYFNV